MCPLGLILALALSATTKKPVTVEVVTAPAPRQIEIVWAPDGSRFAYVDDNTLKVYGRSNRAARDVVSLKTLDKTASAPLTGGAYAWRNRNVAEQRIQWFPDSRRLLVAEKGDLFEVSVGDGQWKQITSTPETEADPKLSPDGALIAFRRNHNLFVLVLSSRKVKRLTGDGSALRLNAEPDWVYPEELGLRTAYWWSPDSRRIAYLQFDVSPEPLYPHADLLGLEPVFEPQRYPRAGSPNAKVRLGVVPAKGGTTKWMNTASGPEAYLARVAWLPGSGEVAVVRLNRPQTSLDLLACAASSGTSRVLLSETNPFWINLADDRDQWRFLADGRRFLWSSEQDGHRHLYVYATDGRRLAQITHGNWEVTALAGVDEKAGAVYFLAGQPTPLERQLFRVPLGGGPAERITSDAGTHLVSMNRSADAFLDHRSNTGEPPRDSVFTMDGQPPAVLRPPDTSLTSGCHLQPVELVHFATPAGDRFFGRLVKPPAFDPARKYPLIVLVYGGPGRQAVQNTWQGASVDQLLAARGFVVWQMDNRGSAGRGHAWEGVLHHRLGAVELQDQKAGIAWLISKGFIDPARVGIYGSSYGGFMTIYSLLHAPDTFRAGVAGAPVTDWRNYDSIYTERYLGTPKENPDGYRASALLPDAEKVRGKLLLLHNFEDDNVLFQNTMQMIDAFARAGKQVDLRLFPQKTHAITGRYRQNLLQAVVDFFEQQLNPGK